MIDRDRPSHPEICAARAAGTWHYVRTASGLAFPFGAPLELAASRVSIGDISEALAKAPRFNGHTPDVTYSVAQHSVYVCDHLSSDPRSALYGLLHDANEAYIGDQVSPLTREIELRIGFDVLGEIKAEIDEAICLAMSLPWPVPESIARMIAAADARAWATETLHFMRDPRYVPGRCDPVHVQPFTRPPGRVWPWVEAADNFRSRYAELRELVA